MKRQIQVTFILFATAVIHAFGQSFTISGPRTIFDLPANRGTGKYTFFSFDKGKEVSLADSNSAQWDIAFSGTTIILNGGTSGPSSVTGQVLTGTSFADQTIAPLSGYVSDGTSQAIPTGSGNGWYNYYPGPGYSGPHTIKPIEDRLIALKLADGRYVKIQILNYYQGAPTDVPTTGPTYTGVDEYYSFRYLIAPVATDDWSQLLTGITNLRANYTHYIFFDLASADTVTTTDSNSVKWDLGFKNTTILVNSGTSGPDEDSAQIVEDDFNSYNTAPLTNWNYDNGGGKAIPTGSDNGWYNYNSTTHVISPIDDRIILVKTSYGRYAKIHMESYYQDDNTSNPAGYYTFSYYFEPLGTTDLTSSSSISGIFAATQEDESFELFPNPVTSDGQIITLRTHELSSGLVVVYDRYGNAIYKTELSGAETAISSSGLEPGMYMVVVQADGKIAQRKIIVE